MHTIALRPVAVFAVCCVLFGGEITRAQVAADAVPAALASENPRRDGATATRAAEHRPSRGITTSLYAGLIAVQALDVHSTLGAVDAGRRETNMMVRWATSRPAVFIGVKAASAAGTILLVERVRRTHPKPAMFLLAAIDSAYAFVVAHNYSGATPRR